MLTIAGRIVLVFGVSAALAAQELVTVIRGPGPFSYFGYGVFPAGDIDRDGAQDIIATTIATQLHPRSRVFFCSGRTGWAMGRVAEEYLAGHTIIPLRDVDGDGYPEVAIPSYSSAEPYVFSPWFGRMHSLQGATEFMAPAGDFDHDGVQDVFTVQTDGRIAVSSGRTGQRIRVFTLGFSPAINAFVGLGDVNGDGVHDFATSKTIGGIEVRSGANETLIANFFTTVHTFRAHAAVRVGRLGSGWGERAGIYRLHQAEVGRRIRPDEIRPLRGEPDRRLHPRVRAHG